jgi:DnaJ domain
MPNSFFRNDIVYLLLGALVTGLRTAIVGVAASHTPFGKETSLKSLVVQGRLGLDRFLTGEAMIGRDSDSYQRQNRVTLAVQITLASGSTMRGNIFMSKQRTMHEELNKGEAFLEFESSDSQKMYLARNVIAVVKEFSVPRADQLQRRPIDQFDAHEVLGLKTDADAHAIRNAYVALAKLYHPDRFARIELPAEVSEYLTAMATRINLAYSELRAHMPEHAA